jgi:hypothetical protein
MKFFLLPLTLYKDLSYSFRYKNAKSAFSVKIGELRRVSNQRTVYPMVLMIPPKPS